MRSEGEKRTLRPASSSYAVKGTTTIKKGFGVNSGKWLNGNEKRQLRGELLICGLRRNREKKREDIWGESERKKE